MHNQPTSQISSLVIRYPNIYIYTVVNKIKWTLRSCYEIHCSNKMVEINLDFSIDVFQTYVRNINKVIKSVSITAYMYLNREQN